MSWVEKTSDIFSRMGAVYDVVNETVADMVTNESLIRSLLPMQDFWLDIMLATREDCIVELCVHELTKISSQLKELGYYE